MRPKQSRSQPVNVCAQPEQFHRHHQAARLECCAAEILFCEWVAQQRDNQ